MDCHIGMNHPWTFTDACDFNLQRIIAVLKRKFLNKIQVNIANAKLSAVSGTHD